MPRRATIAVFALAVLAGATGACSEEDGSPSTTTTSTATTVTTVGGDDALAAMALTASDLPPGFEASSDVDDTLTTFCANEDATAGLQASGREVRGFTRTSGGVSVIHLVLRFRDDGAATFVTQAGEILERCSGVPDVTGLAFEYDDLPTALDGIIAGASDTHVGRHGVSVGSGSLTVELAVFSRGDVGHLVAVLGLDLPRSDVDALAATAFAAVAARTSAG